MSTTKQKYMVSAAWENADDVWYANCLVDIYNMTDTDLESGKVEFVLDPSQSASANTNFTFETWSSPIKGQLVDDCAVIPANGKGRFSVGIGNSSGISIGNLPHAFKVNGEAADLVADSQAPTVPQNLKVSASGAVTLSLNWTASTDNVMVAGYEVSYTNVKSKVTTTQKTATNSVTLVGLTAQTAYTIQVRAYDLASNFSAKSAQLSVTTDKPLPDAGDYTFSQAPFMDYTGWPTPQVSVFGKGSGVKAYTLGFITAADMSGGEGAPVYKPCWGGLTAIADANFPEIDPYTADATISDYGKQDIAAFRAAGGDIAISFGGANSNFLEEHITDVSELAALYQGVLDNYNVNHIDFDIEGGALQQTEMLQRLVATMAVVQKNNPKLQIAFTLPVDGQTSDDSQGLTPFGIDFVRMVKDTGIEPSMFNAMSMDFGSVAPLPDYYTGCEMSLLAMHSQIASVFTHWSDTKIWRRMGATPMFGINDTGPSFTVEHMRKLLAFAQQHNIGLLSGWDATRDYNQGLEMCHTTDHNNLYQCTYEGTESYAYTKIIASYQHK
ncbi:fibronectin type III domain-containing protein [Buttiauxella brennerae]|uniref:fibronectin type III domain-containing protein n=1 Tax=Buttiauxella brennerae TaxID=82988 RepID=UPI00286F1A10|nr:fibronectin type III domain-containing protein [Buttiauxella brennerae]